MTEEQNMNTVSLFDMETFARSIWGEARGESAEGQAAVATHYHSKDIEPKWAKSMRPTALSGAHMFYA